jgi:hypothetical protein
MKTCSRRRFFELNRVMTEVMDIREKRVKTKGKALADYLNKIIEELYLRLGTFTDFNS